jgi:hypothetical protein
MPADDPEPAGSPSLNALADPETRDALCTWAGLTAESQAEEGAAGQDCETVSAQCRLAVGVAVLAGDFLTLAPEAFGAPDDGAPDDGAPDDAPIDLEPLLGCPVSVEEVDACAAELIALIARRSPEGGGCGTAAPAALELGLADVFALGSCIGVALRCPDLLQGFLAPAG